MSQSALKKELSKLNAPQIIEIILDAYKARPEIKEYFDYYLNPDVGKLSEKAKKTIFKEYGRSKWHRSKARVTILNKTVKKFESFMPGSEAIIDLLVYELTIAGETEKRFQFQESIFNHIAKTVEKALTIADSADLTGPLLEKFNRIVSSDYQQASRYFKRLISDTVQQYDSNKTLKKH